MSSRSVFVMAVMSVVLASAFLGSDLNAYVVWVVSGENGSIQAAIDGASDGDIVAVHPKPSGAPYSEDIDFLGKDITVMNSTLPRVPIVISGLGYNSVVTFDSGETRNARLIGFTIVNGTGNPDDCGGGIYCEWTSPTIEDCIIHSNTATFGGGIACVEATPLISGCVIGQDAQSFNQATGQGGGVYVWSRYGAFAMEITDTKICYNQANAQASDGGGMYICGLGGYPPYIAIEECEIANNSCGRFGGGIYGTDGAITDIQTSVISGNLAGYGAGLYITGSGDVEVTYTRVIQNLATFDGGGAYVEGTLVSFEFDIFRGNVAGYQGSGLGGGIYADGAESGSDVVNCLFADNQADEGGAVFVADGVLDIANSTLTSNDATLQNGNAGGIYVQSQANSVTIDNSIIWGNTTPSQSNKDYYFVYSQPVRWSDVGGYPTGGQYQNIDADPVFKTTGTKWWAKKLTEYSPCVDAASNQLDLTDYDFEGDDREIDGDGDQSADVDMGWDEYDPSNP